MYTPFLHLRALGHANRRARAQSPTPTPITVTGPALRRASVASNDVGAASGDLIAISADSVTPNGLEGTTGTAQTTNLSTGLLIPPLVIPFDPSSTDPNEFRLDIPYDANLTSQWTMIFSNDTATPPTTTVMTFLLTGIEGVAPAPFANSVTTSGSTLNPTFTWSFQTPTSVEGVTFLVRDKDMRTVIGGPANTVFTQSLSGTAGSYTLGYTLTPGTHYAVGFRGLVSPRRF